MNECMAELKQDSLGMGNTCFNINSTLYLNPLALPSKIHYATNLVRCFDDGFDNLFHLLKRLNEVPRLLQFSSKPELHSNVSKIFQRN